MLQNVLTTKQLQLTEAQKLNVKHQIQAELYRRSFYEFFIAATKILYPAVDWDYNWHFEYLCNVLQFETERIINKQKKTKDIIINLPFRSGKSILISQLFPVWCWIKDASLTIMQISHSELLAVKHSHSSKMLLESEWFKNLYPDIILRQDTQAKNNYMTSAGGKRISFGINSSIIGEGCNIQILDDLNNPNDGKDVTQKINETYSDTLYSRLNQPDIDIRIILQQRVDGNDICGFLLNKNPDKYKHICIPAKIYHNISPPELSKYYIDGLFWSNRFTDLVLDDYQDTLGSRAFAGQLMQTPAIDADSIIKRDWITLTLAIAEHNKIKRDYFLDSAYGEIKSDNNALLECYTYANDLYITKVWINKFNFPELIKFIVNTIKPTQQSKFYIEGKASGKSIKQQLKASTTFNIIELNPKDSKLTRLNAIAPTVESKRIYIYEDAWNKSFLDEITNNYPINDDQRDVFTYAVDTLLIKNNHYGQYITN